jgi:hypothetical protein
MQAAKRARLLPLPFQLSMRIRHPSMDPAYISKELRIEPEHSFLAGQPRRSQSGAASAAVHTESYWLAALEPAAWFNDTLLAVPEILAAVSEQRMNAALPKNLGWALALFAARCGKAHDAFLRRIRLEGGEVSLLVALTPDVVSSFNLSPEVSRIFGDLGITLEFEITND